MQARFRPNCGDVACTGTEKVTGGMDGRRRSRDFPSFPARVAEGLGPGAGVRMIPVNVPSPRSIRPRWWPDSLHAGHPICPEAREAVTGNALFDSPGNASPPPGSVLTPATKTWPARSSGPGSRRSLSRPGNVATIRSIQTTGIRENGDADECNRQDFR